MHNPSEAAIAAAACDLKATTVAIVQALKAIKRKDRAKALRKIEEAAGYLERIGEHPRIGLAGPAQARIGGAQARAAIVRGEMAAVRGGATLLREAVSWARATAHKPGGVEI